MNKKLILQSRVFNRRSALAMLLCGAGISLALLSLNAKPFAKAAKPNRAASSQASVPEVAPQAPATAGLPRYYNYAPGPGIGESAGEPSIGFNPATKHVMYISGLQTLQVTLPEDITPLGSVPDSCPATWADVSYPLTNVRSADPIMFTDQTTGRTFVSQLNSVTQTSPVLIGLNSLMAYTDDDGANWIPAQVNPPDGSNDHQTVGAGPYPAALSNLVNPTNGGHAVYYCGQGGYVLAITSVAYCSRSDDGGLNFGRAIPAYTDAASGCAQAIHGHVKVAPDGTVYLPNAQCGGGQAVAVSTDGGTTWAVRSVAGASSPAAGAILDPSVGISKDAPVAPATSNTMYFAYAGGEGGDNHMYVTVTKDRGLTWSPAVDVGASLGINNVVFPSVVVGDSNRAAVAFLGTTTSGDHQAANFAGTWYGFVAHTYDGGQTWTTVNATPVGPVQRSACIWNAGGSSACRNLLDFTDATIDDRGRVLFGFADGCVDACETGGSNSFSAKATIARQSGGKGVFAAFDVAEPVLARPACLSVCRDDMASYLTWVAPDNGGSDVTGYKIYRSDATHAEALIGQQIDPTDRTFNDRSVDPAVTSYTYRIKAVNGLGDGAASNSVAVPLGICQTAAGSCLLPGVTQVVDPAGDETDAQTAHDITSVSVAEPIDAGNPTGTGKASNIVVTIKVADLATIPEGWRWAIRFGVIKNGVLLTAPPSGIPGDASASDYFISMVSDGGASGGTAGANSFTWGVTSTPNNTARLFTTKGAIAASSNANADGTITLVLPKSIIQNPGPGDSIAITAASVRLGTPSGGTNETIPDSTGAGSYTLRPDNQCLPNTQPLAALTANVNQGGAPLAVTFNGSASSDPDVIDHIASYTFNFNDGGNDVTQTSPTIMHTFTESGEYIVKLVVTDSRGKLSSNTASFIVEVGAPLTAVVSRKTHGVPAGNFDINLPLTAPPGIECRSGGASNDHKLVFTFANNLTSVTSASVTGGTGSVSSSAIGPNPNQYTVNLTGVTNAQYVTVALAGVQDVAGGNFGVAHQMGVLLGDTTANGSVNSSDIGQAKGNSGQTTTASNFRTDVTVNGAVNSSDIGTIKAQSGTSLP